MAKTVREALPLQSIRLLEADGGAAAIEYALVAALIAGALLTGLSGVGSTFNGKLSQLGSSIVAAQSASSDGGSAGGNGHNGNGNGNGKGGNGKGNNGNGNGNGGPAG